jgi:hypothetical protein
MSIPGSAKGSPPVVPRSGHAADWGADKIECAVKVELAVDGCETREAFYDLKPSLSLDIHIASLFGKFFPSTAGLRRKGQEEERDPNDYALWLPLHLRFLSDEEWEMGIPFEHQQVYEGCSLQFKLSPARQAADALDAIRAGGADAGKAVYGLRLQLMSMHFAEECIEQGLIEELLTLAEAPRPSTASHALQALQVALSFDLGMARLLANRGTERLVGLLKTDNVRILSSSLALLFSLCGRSDGFHLVHSAILSVARERGEASYAAPSSNLSASVHRAVPGPRKRRMGT